MHSNHTLWYVTMLVNKLCLCVKYVRHFAKKVSSASRSVCEGSFARNVATNLNSVHKWVALSFIM